MNPDGGSRTRWVGRLLGDSVEGHIGRSRGAASISDYHLATIRRRTRSPHARLPEMNDTARTASSRQSGPGASSPAGPERDRTPPRRRPDRIGRDRRGGCPDQWRVLESERFGDRSRRKRLGARFGRRAVIRDRGRRLPDVILLAAIGQSCAGIGQPCADRNHDDGRDQCLRRCRSRNVRPAGRIFSAAGLCSR